MTTAGERMVIERRLDALRDAIASGDDEDTKRAYDQVRSSVERALGTRGREVDEVRAEAKPRAIEWKQRTGEGSSGVTGYVDNVALFSIGYGIYRQRSHPWHLTTTLPGMKGSNNRALEMASVEAAQARAERILAAFVKRVTEERS